jgi:two-component system response regulator AtoC
MSLSEETLAQSSTAPVAPVRHPGSLGTAHEWIAIERLVEGSERVGGMLIRSTQFKRLFASIIRFAPHKATVLIQGESGTGKELVARSLHSLGAVPNGPFVTFNCSNLVDTLAEAQLFGHVKGAFTDAREDSLGYFRSANGGTLFLDEIGELPLKLQPKLLRAVEMHEVQPVGSSHSYKVDIRLVAATNRDLRAMVKGGEFRDDLYYRLNAAALIIPPLRDRRDAIPAFVGHFVEQYCRLFAKDIRRISRQAIEALCAYSWPGNVRELAHAVESAVLMADGDCVTLNELPSNVLEGRDASTEPIAEASSAAAIPIELPEAGAPSLPANGAEATGESKFSLDAAIREASKDALVRALNATHGNCHRAADLLGVSRYTVYRMLARYGLTESRGYRSWRKSTI